MRFIEPSTPTKPRKRSLQEGQAIVLIALLILVLFGSGLNLAYNEHFTIQGKP